MNENLWGYFKRIFQLRLVQNFVNPWFTRTQISMISAPFMCFDCLTCVWISDTLFAAFSWTQWLRSEAVVFNGVIRSSRSCGNGRCFSETNGFYYIWCCARSQPLNLTGSQKTWNIQGGSLYWKQSQEEPGTWPDFLRTRRAGREPAVREKQTHITVVTDSAGLRSAVPAPAGLGGADGRHKLNTHTHESLEQNICSSSCCKHENTRVIWRNMHVTELQT